MDKKEKPVIKQEIESDFVVRGKSLFITRVVTYENKDYIQIRIEFPNGSYEQCFVSLKRLEQKAVKGA